MHKLYCLYWVPGSAGDMLQQLITGQSNIKGAMNTLGLDDNGRAIPKLDPEFAKEFESIPNQWYFREWTVDDVIKLDSMTNDSPILIGTHRLDQLQFIKNNSKNCVTIGITYSEYMFPAVIKNWCLKIAADSDAIKEIYTKSNPALFKKIKENNALGEYILREQLTFGTNIPKSVSYQFDITVSLEKLYIQDLSDLQEFDIDLEFYKSWVKRQDMLYKVKFSDNTDIKGVLGYNPLASTETSEIALSSYDNVLLLMYCKQHNFKYIRCNSLTDLTIFFETVRKR